MPLPGVTNIIRDGGLGVTTPGTSVPHVIGVCNDGPLNVSTRIANPRLLSETFGVDGPLCDAAGYILGLAGGPIVVTRVGATVPATYDDGSGHASTGTMTGSQSTPGDTNDISLAVATSAPKNSVEIYVVIVKGGTLAATTFQYSLDGGITMSPPLQAAATVALNTSGVTLEFGDGSTEPYVSGETYDADTSAPMYYGTNLATGFLGVDASLLSWDFFVFTGQAATAAAAAVLGSAISSKMFAYEALGRYYGALMSSGLDATPAVLTAWNNFVSLRVAHLYGEHRAAPPFGQVGRAAPWMPAVDAAGRLASANTMSTDLAQVAGASSVGALPTTLEISHNEYLSEAGLDDAHIGTLRTYPNTPGFYVTNVWMAGPNGSDFQWWQHRRIMDEACKQVHFQHTQLISSSVLTKSDGSGSLLESSALAIEQRVQRGLDNILGSGLREVGPNAIDGTTGHVSDQKYQVDRGTNVLSTSTLIATVSILPRGYLKFIRTTLSYQLTV